MSASPTGWVSQIKQVVQDSHVDYFKVKPVRYWLDFLLSASLAYTSATIYLTFPLGSWQQLVCFPIAVFWLYRLGSLVHEVCHLAHHEMQVFKVVWNLLAGVMTLTPSPFFTRHHRDHHSQKMYGTPEDPEYVVNIFRPGSPLSIIGFVLLVAAFPLIVFLRFFLAPLTFLHPRLREWALTRASALTMNWRYERKLNDFDRWAMTWIELLCFVRAVMIPGVVLIGAAPWYRLPLLYSLGLGVLVLNQLRQLADHHFETDGRQFAMEDHLFDSCNFTGRDFFTWLFFPFSIRYHALHHLFPTMPYHNLKSCHNYLVEALPADSPYRLLDQTSWWLVARRTLMAPNRPKAQRLAEMPRQQAA
jgi:fatty acid desaturase